MAAKFATLLPMERIYGELIADHFANNRQMVFLSGPRQVGKTTLAHDALPDAAYFNYDRTQDALAISSGAERIAALADLQDPAKASHGTLFDELHKFPNSREEPLSSALVEFQKVLSAPYAFQVAIEGLARREDALLQRNGYRILRFMAEDVCERLDAVLGEIGMFSKLTT